MAQFEGCFGLDQPGKGRFAWQVVRMVRVLPRIFLFFGLLTAGVIVGAGLICAETNWYSLQVSAFRERSRAIQDVKSWRARGMTSFFRREIIDGREAWHRVYVGRFVSKREAKAAARKLLSEKVISDYFIRSFDAPSEVGRERKKRVAEDKRTRRTASVARTKTSVRTGVDLTEDAGVNKGPSKKEGASAKGGRGALDEQPRTPRRNAAADTADTAEFVKSDIESAERPVRVKVPVPDADRQKPKKDQRKRMEENQSESPGLIFGTYTLVPKVRKGRYSEEPGNAYGPEEYNDGRAQEAVVGFTVSTPF